MSILDIEPSTPKLAAEFIRALDDQEGLGNNSLAVAFGGGHGAKRAKAALAAVRLLVEDKLDDAPRTPFGDMAA